MTISRPVASNCSQSILACRSFVPNETMLGGARDGGWFAVLPAFLVLDGPINLLRDRRAGSGAGGPAFDHDDDDIPGAIEGSVRGEKGVVIDEVPMHVFDLGGAGLAANPHSRHGGRFSSGLLLVLHVGQHGFAYDLQSPRLEVQFAPKGGRWKVGHLFLIQRGWR